MFSKNIRRTIHRGILLGLVWGLGACSNFLNEKQQDPQSFEVSNARFACLQSLPEEINKFMDGGVADENIRKGFDCGKEALSYFKNKTRGTLDDTYTLEDIRNFFGKYFLKENNVTPAFAAELFKVKKVILGGSEHTITKLEIQKLIDLLEVLKQEAVHLRPHMATLIGQKQEPQWMDVDRATDQLLTSLWAIFKEVDLVKSTYSFKDLQQFMDGLDDFINAKQGFLLKEKLGSNVALLEAIKNVMMGEKARFDNVKDWQSAVKTTVGLYKEGLRYKYFLAGQDLQQPERLLSLMLMVDDAFSLIEESLPMQRHNAITFSSLDALLDRLAERKMLPLALTAKSLKDIYKKVILRVLDPRRDGDARGLQALERTHLMSLKLEWLSFRLHQKFIDTLPYDKNDGISLMNLREATETFDVLGAIAKLSSQSLEQETLLESWGDAQVLIHKDRPVFFNSQGRLMIVDRPTLRHQTRSSLTKWNLMRALSRVLMIGYGKNHTSSLQKEVISEEGMELWYKDFNQIGIELKAFDKRSTDAGSRSFKEANFFTFNGNGDKEMSYLETFDFVSFLISGGVSSSESIRQDILQKFCGLKDLDIFDYPWLDEKCFKTQLRAHFSEYFNNLPGATDQVSVMSDAQWDEFYHNLMQAARVSPADGGRIETADLRTAVMMLHYTESLMTVYDRDHNGRLNIEELQKAAPRFTEFMKPLSFIKLDVVIEDFFLFLVYKGKKPDLSYVKFVDEKANERLKDVTRSQILLVFKVLKDEAAKK